MKRLLVMCIVLVASAAHAQEAPLVVLVRHVGPAETGEARPLRLSAVVDNAWVEAALLVRYRGAGSQAAFAEVPFERSSTGAYFAVIPAAAVARPGVEYYVVGIAKDGAERPYYASAEKPHEVRVEPATQLRWIEAERRRLGGRYDFARFDVSVSSFGNEIDEGAPGGAGTSINDYFVRGELSWTHRQVSALYSFSLGYGFVQGTTPVRDPNAPNNFIEETHGVRYGFGSVRLRTHESFWLDGGVLLGFSQDGFAAGVRGVMIFGRPWRSCVHLGGEIIQDTGSNLWLKLQWDTVPPLLMSAQILITTMPDAEFDATVMSFNVDYPVSPRFTVGAGITGSARDNRSTYPGATVNANIEF